MRVIDRAEGLIEVFSEAGFDLYASGQQQEALKLFLKDVEDDLKDSHFWVLRGDHLYHLDHYAKALVSYGEAIRINSLSAWILSAWEGKGKCLFAMDKYEEAIVCFDEVLRIDNEYSSAWGGKGYALYLLGKYTEGLTCLNNALKRFDPLTMARKGFTLLAMKRYEEAIPCFEESQECIGCPPCTCTGLVLAIKEVKGSKAAMQQIDKFLEFFQEISEQEGDPYEPATTAELKKLRKKYCNELKIKPSKN